MTKEIKEGESLLRFGNEDFSKQGKQSEYRTLGDVYIPMLKKMVAGENVSNEERYRAQEIAKDILYKAIKQKR